MLFRNFPTFFLNRIKSWMAAFVIISDRNTNALSEASGVECGQDGF